MENFDTRLSRCAVAHTSMTCDYKFVVEKRTRRRRASTHGCPLSKRIVISGRQVWAQRAAAVDAMTVGFHLETGREMCIAARYETRRSRERKEFEALRGGFFT